MSLRRGEDSAPGAESPTARPPCASTGGGDSRQSECHLEAGGDAGALQGAVPNHDGAATELGGELGAGLGDWLGDGLEDGATENGAEVVVGRGGEVEDGGVGGSEGW